MKYSECGGIDMKCAHAEQSRAETRAWAFLNMKKNVKMIFSCILNDVWMHA